MIDGKFVLPSSKFLIYRLLRIIFFANHRKFEILKDILAFDLYYIARLPYKKKRACIWHKTTQQYPN